MSTNTDRISQVTAVRHKFEALLPTLDERRRRLWAASEAQSLGHGGIAIVHEATNLTRLTIATGVRELKERDHLPVVSTVRRPGGGRKRLAEKDTTLLRDLDTLIEPTTRGDPENPLRWTCRSLRNLVAELTALGHPISVEKVSQLLVGMGYSLQANQKTREGGLHEDRDAQFRHISDTIKSFVERDQPAVSVDAKKKELIGDFKNAGREWHPKGSPEQVRVHDFIDDELGKAIPYGVYDIADNSAWVSVGTDHDTAQFAANTIMTWWRQMGRIAYPQATELLITADGGGSNSSRSRLWKLALQQLADETGLTITVRHLPPGTSKWNKIEHRLFSYITQNWRGRPLVSHEVVVNLIGSTTTRSGLRVNAAIDNTQYPKGIAVTDAQLASVRITKSEFHGDWNYSIEPLRT
jgi:hypothetical protein